MGILAFIIMLTGIDIGIKNRIDTAPDEDFPKPCRVFGKHIKIYKKRNRGFVFGVLEQKQNMVKYLPVLVTVFLWGKLSALGKRGSRAEKLSLAFLLAGGLGNIYDRMHRGYVVDYLHIDIKLLKKIIFNLADVFVFLGTLIYMISGKERS